MLSPPVATQSTTVPLCVDLDGTLIRTDLLWESLVRLLRSNPLYAFLVPLWLMRGRAGLKAQLAARTTVDVAALPYHQPLLEFLRAERRERPIVLVTASDRALAEQVARHLDLFTEVLASDGQTNLRGKTKLATLAARFGERGFDYAGNSSVDLPVWAGARSAILVGSERLAIRARRCAQISRVFSTASSAWRALFRALRPHQWVKNLIVLVPALAAHKLTQIPTLVATAWAFLAFCLASSAVYVLNDLADLEADRHHPAKRFRPFAAGDLPLPAGLVLAPLLLAASAAVAWRLPVDFGKVLGIYLLLTTTYSWRLKQIPLLDVFCLAGLYTIRLIAGHESTRIEYSFWLLVFSMFIFLSLALVKRFVELASARQQNKTDLKGRGYAPRDLELVATLGSNSGYLAALVLALYVNSEASPLLYKHPMVLLLICPLLLYWISRVWLLAHRGQMHDDPIVFALKDAASYLVGVFTLVVLWLATGH